MSKAFWKAVGIRAVRTMAQTAVSLIPAAVTIDAVDWRTVVGTAALSGVVSVLTAIATDLPEAPRGGDPDATAELPATERGA